MSGATTTEPTRADEAEALVAELMDAGGPHPDPYPIYDRLREIDRLFYSERLGVRVVTGYQEALEVHLNPALGLSGNAAAARRDPRFEDSAYLQLLPRMTPWIDPPNHTRLRKIFAPAFTPRRIERMEPFIQGRVDELLDQCEEKETPDMVTDFAVLLPIATITNLLGLPTEVYEMGLRWAQSMAEAILAVNHLDDDLLAIVDGSVSEGAEFLDGQIEERLRQPTDDLLTALMQSEVDGEKLTREETTALAYQLFIAAAETTVGSIGLGLANLMRHRDQFELLRGDPELGKPATEEILRYEAPTQMNMRRFALEDTEVGGVAIKEGECLLPVNGAGNRDPKTFQNPHAFDLTRDEAGVLTFGRGIHFCVGAPLARLQIRIAVGTVLRRYPDIAFASEPVLRGSPGLRAVAHLPVELNRG